VRAGIVAEHAIDGSIPQCRDQAHHVPHQVEHAQGSDVAVVIAVPSGGASVSALIGGDDVSNPSKKPQALVSATVAAGFKKTRSRHRGYLCLKRYSDVLKGYSDVLKGYSDVLRT